MIISFGWKFIFLEDLLSFSEFVTDTYLKIIRKYNVLGSFIKISKANNISINIINSISTRNFNITLINCGIAGQIQCPKDWSSQIIKLNLKSNISTQIRSIKPLLEYKIIPKWTFATILSSFDFLYYLIYACFYIELI